MPHRVDPASESRDSPTISALVPTLNESSNLPFLLPTLAWCDEIIVIDQGSTDDTAMIVEKAGAVLLETERRPDFDAIRHQGAEAAYGDWLLAVDADEMIPRPLARRLRDLASSTEIDVVSISRLNYFLGPYRTGGFWPDWQPRFFRRGTVDLAGSIHAPFIPLSERTVQLPAEAELAIHHFPYRGATALLSKLNLYTDLELQKPGPGGGPVRQLVLQPLKIFLSRYFRYGAWRQGARGLWLSSYWAIYLFMTAVKRWERQALPAGEAAEKRARQGILDTWSESSGEGDE
jgi:glycosyltransferase involved in cell wall biosynthesis